MVWFSSAGVARSVRRFARAFRVAAIRLVSGNDLTYASSIAYYALISLFPLLLLSAAALGRWTTDEAARADVSRFLIQFFPAQIDLVRTQLDAVAGATIGMSVVSVIVTIWVAAGIFRAISTAVNGIWDLERPPSLLRHHGIAFALFGAVGTVFVVSVVWLSLGDLVRTSRIGGRMVDALPLLETLLAIPSRYLPLAAVILIAAFVFAFVPNTAVRVREVWVGAIVTGLLWQAGLAGFSWYLRALSELTLAGSITAVVAFLFWVYTSAAIFLFGAEFTHAWIREARADAGVDAGAP
ncbi:MAG: YihY/virulence factor BrkB family protein [Acidobacteria bacterium]|nr:YihY/virulence factor BrkB family protein [Acidobacteriota bacterium]